MPVWMTALPLATVTLAALIDVRSGRIPNLLTLSSFVLALGLRAGTQGLGGVTEALVAALLVTLPCAWLFVRGALGGGDVKLFAALAAALGPALGLRIELTSFVLVTVYALLLAVWQGHGWALLRASSAATLHLFSPGRFARPAPIEGFRTQLRMGPFIALGCGLVLFEAWR